MPDADTPQGPAFADGTAASLVEADDRSVWSLDSPDGTLAASAWRRLR